MLQFITSKSDKYSIKEEVQMAIEGGCLWIQVSKSLPYGVTQKDIIEELRPLCEEKETFLLVDSDVELVKEANIHGVLLKNGDMNPAEAREYLGAEAVIGVEVNNANEILALKGLDIDYVVIDFDKFSISEIQNIIEDANKNGNNIHIVVGGRMEIVEMLSLMQIGVAGFALSEQIIESPNPVVATKNILTALSH